MTNLPPPDPRSSRLGFDELVAVVVAFTVIGTIIFVSLRPKDKGFDLKSLTPWLATPQSSPNTTATPSVLPPSSVQNKATPLPEPSAVSRATPVIPVTPATPAKAQPIPIPVPPVTTSSSRAETAPALRAKPVNKQVNFSDVPQVFWARPYIEALAKRGIITGFPDATFRPNKPVTRAEFATQLQKAFDQKVVMDAPKYNDIPNSFWASSAIQETSRSGFLRGYPGNVFRPNQQITKVQALISLTKGLGLSSSSAPNQALKVYQDADTIPKYATNTVAVATESGIVVNYPNRQKLDPNKTITRAEAAALTYQAMAKAGKVPPISSDYAVAQP